VVLLKLVDLLAVDMLLHFGPANGLFLFEDMGAVALLKIFDLLAVDLLLCVRACQRPLLCEPENKGAVEPRKSFGLVAMPNFHLNLSFSAVPTPRLPNNFAALCTCALRRLLARSVKPPAEIGGSPGHKRKRAH
jgi:hypothetical protein